MTAAASSGRYSMIPVRAVDDRGLGHAAFRLLAILGTYSDKSGWCWPSKPTLANRLGVTRQAVGQQLKKLVQRDHVEVHPHRDRMGRITYRYRLCGLGAQAELSEAQAEFSGMRKLSFQVAKAELAPHIDERPNRTNPIERIASSGDAPDDTSALFEQFWKAYPSRRPHRSPRKAAQDIFSKIIASGVSPDTIIQAAKLYSQSVENIDDPKFIPQALNWLRQKSYADEATTTGQATGPTTARDQFWSDFPDPDVLSRHNEWKPRLSGWALDPGSRWLKNWGPKPDCDDCDAPPSMVTWARAHSNSGAYPAG
jgi:DNA-binding MarR family transcriptional regulator